MFSALTFTLRSGIHLAVHLSFFGLFSRGYVLIKGRAATAGKVGKVWSLPKFWVSIRSYKKQPVKKIWGRILDLAWLKFAVAALAYTIRNKSSKTKVVCVKKKYVISMKILVGPLLIN